MTPFDLNIAVPLLDDEFDSEAEFNLCLLPAAPDETHEDDEG